MGGSGGTLQPAIGTLPSLVKATALSCARKRAMPCRAALRCAAAAWGRRGAFGRILPPMADPDTSLVVTDIEVRFLRPSGPLVCVCGGPSLPCPHTRPAHMGFTCIGVFLHAWHHACTRALGIWLAQSFLRPHRSTPGGAHIVCMRAAHYLQA